MNELAGLGQAGLFDFGGGQHIDRNGRLYDRAVGAPRSGYDHFAKPDQALFEDKILAERLVRGNLHFFPQRMIANAAQSQLVRAGTQLQR